MHYLDYNEKTEHGTSAFPVAYYYIDENHPRYEMPFHWHKEMEIILIKEGNFQLFLDKDEYTAGAGDLLLIHEGITHGAMPESCIYECIVFDFNALMLHTEVCRRYFKLISKHKVRLQAHFPGDSRSSSSVLRVGRHLFKTMRESRAGYEPILLGTLFEFFGILIQKKLYTQTDALPTQKHEKIGRLKPVLEYIELHYASHCTLSDLSRIAGMSPKYFCRYFQAFVHRTPMDYLNYYRIECACSQLNGGEASITEIALNCGFNDSSYFIRTFRKYKGVTPKQYSMHVL